MNVGFFYVHPPGESMGSINRVRFFCEGLTRFNHKIIIFTLYEFNLDWGSNVKFLNISRSLSKISFKKKVYQILRIILNKKFFTEHIFFHPLIIRSIINRLARSLYKTLTRDSFKLDFIIGEQELACFALDKIREKITIPIIIDYHNFWLEELVENGVFSRDSKRYKQILDLEDQIIKNGDLIITNGEALRVYLKGKFNINKKIKKIISIPNGGFPLKEKPKKRSYPLKIINAGMINKKSNMILFLRSLPYILKDFPEIEIFITKKGDNVKEIIDIAERMNLPINFYWKDSYNEFLNLLSSCTIGIVTSSDSLPRSLGIASKIIDYLSVGLPIVGNDIGGWTKIIEIKKLGLLSSNHPKDLAKKIKKIIENESLYQECSKNCIKLIKNEFNCLNSTKKLLSYVYELF